MKKEKRSLRNFDQFSWEVLTSVCNSWVEPWKNQREVTKYHKGSFFVTNHSVELETQFAGDRGMFSFEQNLFDPWFGYVLKWSPFVRTSSVVSELFSKLSGEEGWSRHWNPESHVACSFYQVLCVPSRHVSGGVYIPEMELSEGG